MIQHIDTVEIKYLSPYYIRKDVTEKTGVFKNKTNVIERNVDLDYERMRSRGYPDYVKENMGANFKNENKYYSDPRISGVRSVEFTLNQFIQQHQPCKIISVIRESDYRLCVVWEEVKTDG